jgi:hypothetical protein
MADNPDRSTPFNVVVKTGRDDVTLNVAVKPLWTLSDLQNAVEGATGIPGDDQKLSLRGLDLRHYQGPLDHLLRASSSGLTLSHSEGALRRTGNSVLDSSSVNGAMRLSESCGAMPGIEERLRASGNSFYSRFSKQSAGTIRSGGTAASSRMSDGLKRNSNLRDYRKQCAAKIVRERNKQFSRPVHLRTAADPIKMGSVPDYTTSTMRCMKVPVEKMSDPYWSQDVPQMNTKIGTRLEWERKMAAALPGSIMPELKHMPPKTYVAVPPKPYFEPGKAHLSREG